MLPSLYLREDPVMLDLSVKAPEKAIKGFPIHQGNLRHIPSPPLIFGQTEIF